MTACGFQHLAEKVHFLAKFNHGPYKGGHWLGVQKMAAEAFIEAVRAGEPVCVGLLQGRVSGICLNKNWAGPATDAVWERTKLCLLWSVYVFPYKIQFLDPR